jgi:type 1 fimbria pilin
MRTSLCIALLLASAIVAAGDKPPQPITATGTMYFTFDIASETTVDGVLFARFVPDAKSMKRFPAVKSGPYPGPVRHISLEPAETVLEVTLGKVEADRVSRGTEREIEVRVEVVLANYKPTIECDARAYYAKLVSVKALGKHQVASLAKAPHGC